MKKEKLTFRVTAKITKYIEVDVDYKDGEDYNTIIDRGNELAHELFNPNYDGNDETYEQDAYLIPNKH